MRGMISSIVTDLKSKNIIVNSSLLVCFIILGMTVYSGQYDKFGQFVDLFAIIICFSITIMSYSKINEARNDFYKYMGKGLIYIGILFLFHLINGIHSTKTIQNNFLSYSTVYFQIIVILVSAIFCKITYNNKSLHLIYSFSVTSILGIWCLLNIGVIESKNTMISINLIFAISIALLYLYAKAKNPNIKVSQSYSSIRIKNFLLFSVIAIILIQCGQVYESELSTLLGGFIKFISYVFVYLYFEDNVLNIYYEYTKKIIKDTQKDLTETNKALVLQTKYLEESKKLYEKSYKSYLSILNSINKGIYLFVDDKLFNMNIKAKDFLRVNNYEELDCQLEYILWNLTDEFFTEDELEFGFMKDFYVKNNNECIDIRVYLLKIDARSKFILVSNTTESKEYRHLNDYLQTYLNAEKTTDDLYSNISHEIRTPINVISSALQLNEMYLSSNNFEGVIKYNTVIRKNCLRLIRTINNFIDADKLEGGFFDLVKKRYNIIYIIDQVIDASIKYFYNSNTQIIFDPEEEEMFLHIDKNQLQRILLNIFSNTLKYGKKEGGLVEVKTTRGKRHIEISIHNDAPPIPEDKRRYIFDKFTKIDNSLARPSEGSGLGLFLTKSLVEANNGTIELTTDENGNTFRLMFPVSYYDSYNVEVTDVEALIDLEEKVDIEFADVYF